MKKLQKLIEKTNKIDFLKLGERILAIVAIGFSLTMAMPASADLPTPPCGAFNGVSCSNVSGPTTLIIYAINWLLGIAAVVAVLFLVWGGFQYIFSAGNAEKAEGGRNTVFNALIGLAIIILSYLIVTLVSKTVTSASNGSPLG